MWQVVTPRAGVWIEIIYNKRAQVPYPVTPRAGVWIEIPGKILKTFLEDVTPRAGVWIEIEKIAHVKMTTPSHSPCGSVD